MSDAPPRPPVGTIGWTDLTVPDADGLRDFYSAVVGWGADAPCASAGIKKNAA